MQLTVPKGSVGIHWFEQNAYAFKDPRGTVVLVDPYFPLERPAEWFIRLQPPVVESEFRTDHVLFTHAHGDHTNSETVTRIRQAWPAARYLGPQESIDQVVREAGVSIDRTVVLSAGGATSLNGLTVHAFYSKPPAGDPQANIAPPDSTHLGYVVELGGLKLYISGDAINTLADHDELLEPVAALKPDIGFLTTHPTEGEFPFFDGSVRMARKLGLKTAVPSHYACFAKRTYDPKQWAALFGPGDPQPLIIPWNSHVIYP
jgi:L-ascorbate metabolism protein UlaG (beta-lactamase superfamily)